MEMKLSKLQETVKDRDDWCAARGPSQTLLSDWTTKQGHQSDRIESTQTASFQPNHTVKALYPNTVTP